MNPLRDERGVIHTIPVPVGWSPEQAWEAIRRSDLLQHPAGEPSWVNIETTVDDRFVRLHLNESEERDD